MRSGTIQHVSATKSSKRLPERNKRLERLLQMHGWTQEEFAIRAGLEREHVNRLITGRLKATTDLVRAAIAKALGVTRDDVADYLSGRIEAAELVARKGGVAPPSSRNEVTVEIPVIRGPSGDRRPKLRRV